MSGHFIETDNFVIVVDKWDASYVRRAGNKPHYFFLTHLHADHIKGLTSTWSRIIYTSPFNAWLLPMRRSVRPELLRALDLDTTHTIQKPNDGTEFQVTVIDANHCPGSVMFLFQGSFGNILYTGDFRYHPSMLNNPSLAEVVGKKELHVMYIDNTYADPSCQFPSREEALQEVLTIIDEYPDYKFLIGLRQLGKEEVLRAIALHINERICVSPQRLQVLAKLEYEDVFTTDTSRSRIQAVELHTITQRHGQENTRQISIRLSSIYECTTSERRVGNIFNVAYSDHSSHSELQQCVRDLRPHKLVPIVIPKVLDTTKYMGLWSRMSSVNCIIPDCILNLCWPASTKSQLDSVIPPSKLQRKSPLVIKYHLTKDQQTMKHSDEGSLVTSWDAQGPQLTVNNKARKHIKASWTRLAPKLLSQKGITFNDSSSPTSDTGFEMENVCNGISNPQLPWRGAKRKRDIDPRSPLSAQNKTSESEGEDSVVEVPLSGDEDGILTIPSSAMDLQLHLRDMKDSALLKNGVKTNGVNSDKDALGNQFLRKEISGDCSTNLESMDASCGSPDKNSENRNLAQCVRSTSVISNLNTESGSTRRQSLARTVKQSPPDKTAATTVTRKPVILEKKEKPKKLVKKSASPKVVKMSGKETTNISPVKPVSIEAEAKDKDANRVIKVTRRSAKEICEEDASIDITLNSLQESGISERFSDKKEGENVKLSAPLNNEQDEDSESTEDLSLSNTEKTSPSRRESAGVKLDSETNSPTKKSSSPSTRAMAAWNSAEELARKQTERALKALEALNDMKGFKTRGGISRTGGLKVANEVIALRRASGDSNPVIAPSACSGPKVRCRKANILSSMASTFEKDALKSPASVIESSSKSKQLNERRSPKAKSPAKSSANEVTDTSDTKILPDEKMKEDSLAIAVSANKNEMKTDILPPQVDTCQSQKPANDVRTVKSDQGMKMVEIIKRSDLACVKRSSLNVGLMRLKVDIAMNSNKRVRRPSLPANLSSLCDSAEMNRAAPKEKVQMWRSKISKLTQRRYKFKSPLKLRHSARLSLLKVPSKEQEPSVTEDSSEDFDKQETCGKHRSDSEESLLINEQDKYDNKSDTQSCSGALESVHNDIRELRRHSPRLSDSSTDSISTRVLRKSGKLIEKSVANINGEEPPRRQSIRLSKEGSTEFKQPNIVDGRKNIEQPGKTSNKADIVTREPPQSTKRQSLRLTQKGSGESKTLNADTNPKHNPVEETNSKRLSPRGHGKEERKMSSESSVGDKPLKKLQSLQKDSKLTKNEVNPDKSSSQLSSTDGNSGKEKITEVVDLTQNESHILSFGSENAQNTVNILNEMRKILNKKRETKVKESNVMKSVSGNISTLNPFHPSKPVPSSLSIQLLPESLVSAASPTESGKSDWSIEIVPISNLNPDESKGIASSSVGGIHRHRFNDLKTPDSLSIKLMSSNESNSRKEPSPPSLSISVASDGEDDVIVLSEESSRTSRPSLIHSVKHPGQHKKHQSGSHWPPSKLGTSKYATPKLPQTGERSSLKKPAQSLIKPAPQAIWKENHNERTSNRSGDNVVVVDIETEQDHCPVHCTCGQAARRREKSRQTQRDFDEDSDSSSLYEVPLSPEDFEASQAMVAFGEGWLDLCFDGEEDKTEFLASYDPYLTKAVHEPRRCPSKVQQELFKPTPSDQTATNNSTISSTIPSVVEEEPQPPMSKQQETDSKLPDPKSSGKEKSRKPSSDIGRCDSLLKEIEKKIRAYNEQQSKKRSRNSSDSSCTPDGNEPKKTRRRTEIEFLSETRQRTASKSRYRMSVRRSLDHLMTRQKLRSEKRLIVSSANHS